MEKLDLENKPITIVSGLPRSGTSMLMKMLEAGGMEILTDQIRKADDDNPKGYFEFERAKKLPTGDIDWLPEARGKAVKVISALLTYLPPGFSYRVLFIERSIQEVLASQRQMLITLGKAPDKVSDDELIRIYQKHMVETKKWLASQRNFAALYLSYNEILKSPEEILPMIGAFLESRLNLPAMRAAIDLNLYRQRK